MAHETSIQTESDPVRAIAAKIFVRCFPLLVADAIRRAHPLAFHQFQFVRPDGESLAPGLAEDDDLVVVTSAWIDLSEQPVVVRLPRTEGRYLNLTLFDSAGEPFASVGSRTGDDAGTDLALVGPRWRGELPSGLRAKRAPSEFIWGVSRIHPHSGLDQAATLALAKRQCLALLPPAVNRPRTNDSTVDSPSSPSVRQIAEMAPAIFFHRLEYIVERAPANYQWALRAQVNTLRGKLGGPPPVSAWDSEFHAALSLGFADAMEIIEAAAQASSVSDPLGWPTLPADAHSPATSSLARAARAYTSMGAPLHHDLLSLLCEHDQTGRPLSGAHAYHIHFSKDAEPPVRAFWRLSVRPSANHESRGGLGSRSGLTLNADGSLDVIVQRTPPSVPLIPNWLPSPEGDFSLIMRLYTPRPAVLDGNWRMPPVERLDSGAGGKPGRPVRRRRPVRPPPYIDHSRSVFEPTASAWRALP